MLQFRSAGAPFLQGFTRTEIYFAAQHFGMPTRLLDWSTNPLAALFFACEGADQQDGFVYAMNARQVIPDDAKWSNGEPLNRAVMTMHHPWVEYAVGLSFWAREQPGFKPYVLPVRPDAVPGRIGQQSSCFTLHMHRAEPVKTASSLTLKIPSKFKASIKDELHRVNINQFTTYYDLDHLSREIRRGFGC